MTTSEKALARIRLARGRKPKSFIHNKNLSFAEALTLAMKKDKDFAKKVIGVLAPISFPLFHFTKDLK